ncbi:hypothetical protein TA3x_004254 [Tundrisphaera sp. TA3]|uniref:hypothetical protein n=1 Tax=Tundrisphaera sp. TA3 TaxID=3435775 RepID=UPI003EBA3009
MAEELGCDVSTLEIFLQSIDDFAGIGKKISDKEAERISARWYSSGAAAQYEEEGALVPLQQPVSYQRHVRESDADWLRVRLARHILDGWSCVICGSKDEPGGLQTHHTDYSAMSRGDLEGEVLASRSFCERCHKKTHGI